MSRPLPVLLLAGVVASGCSRDAPPLAPESVNVDAIPAVAASAVARVPVDDPVADALTRLLPALGPRGAALRTPLQLLQARAKDRTALAAVQRTLDALASTLPSEFQPDLDALRLQLGIPFPE